MRCGQHARPPATFSSPVPGHHAQGLIFRRAAVPVRQVFSFRERRIYASQNRIYAIHFRINAGGLLALAMPTKSRAAVIVAYNFGPTGTSFTYAATTIAANVTASGINSAGDEGNTTTNTQDNGVGGGSGWYSNIPAEITFPWPTLPLLPTTVIG